MASDKIISKIIDNANDEAKRILKTAQDTADKTASDTEKATQKRLAELAAKFEDDKAEIDRRAKLNAGLEERKNLLAAKRGVMNKAFDLAASLMAELPDKQWAELIRTLVIDAVDAETEYIKVPEKDMKKYTHPFLGAKSFLDQLNDMLAQQGHTTPLKLDRDPAWFEDGVMLIGKYSDVNASFDVLIENMKKQVEWDVTQILFDQEV